MSTFFYTISFFVNFMSTFLITLKSASPILSTFLSAFFVYFFLNTFFPLLGDPNLYAKIIVKFYDNSSGASVSYTHLTLPTILLV